MLQADSTDGCFHRINDAAKWQDFSSFPSGTGEELSPLMLFPISFPQERARDLTEDSVFVSD